MSRNILVVDDDVRGADALATLLRGKGYEVRVAYDDKEAAQTLKTFAADTVLLDIGLPVLSGDSFATFLTIRHPGMRIIFISGNYGMVDPERFGEGTLFLRKPLDIDTLLEALESPLPTRPVTRTYE